MSKLNTNGSQPTCSKEELEINIAFAKEQTAKARCGEITYKERGELMDAFYDPPRGAGNRTVDFQPSSYHHE